MSVPSLKQILNLISFAELKRISDRLVALRSSRTVKSIAILSESPGEGKTLFTTALAYVFGKILQQRVLVVDMQTFHSPGSIILDQAMEMDELASAAGEVHSTMLANTDLLPCRELLKNAEQGIEFRMQEIIEKQGANYDLIIFDTSALSLKNRNNVDPCVVARYVDAALLIVGERTLAANTTSAEAQKFALGNLNICGFVYNEGAHAR